MIIKTNIQDRDKKEQAMACPETVLTQHKAGLKADSFFSDIVNKRIILPVYTLLRLDMPDAIQTNKNTCQMQKYVD
jgi:hypothetical protein